MTSTCRPTPSMCWQLWPSFNRIKKTAPNHRSRLIRLPFQRLQWTWVRLKSGRRHTLLRTTTPSTCLKTSLVEYTGIFLQTRHLNRMNPDESIPLEAHPPHRRLHRDKREDWAWRCLFLKGGSVAAHLRGMRPTPSTKKGTLMLREKLKL